MEEKEIEEKQRILKFLQQTDRNIDNVIGYLVEIAEEIQTFRNILLEKNRHDGI